MDINLTTTTEKCMVHHIFHAACQRPDVDDNVRLHPNQKTYRIGQRVDFRCDKGFRLEGPGWLKCQDDGEFNGNPPRCVPDGEKSNYVIDMLWNKIFGLL